LARIQREKKSSRTFLRMRMRYLEKKRSLRSVHIAIDVTLKKIIKHLKF